MSTGRPCLTFRSKEEGHPGGVQWAWAVRLLHQHLYQLVYIMIRDQAASRRAARFEVRAA